MSGHGRGASTITGISLSPKADSGSGRTGHCTALAAGLISVVDPAPLLIDISSSCGHAFSAQARKCLGSSESRPPPSSTSGKFNIGTCRSPEGVSLQ